MTKYKVQFEVPYMYQGVIPIMYHPNNVDLPREIVAVTIEEDD
ncbi:hypothetical protein QI259_00485 [Staphylococcus saprophyticus]|nr:hypothetical protein [Staphylococcus saprophyticus]